jgi:hypothetical protein
MLVKNLWYVFVKFSIIVYLKFVVLEHLEQVGLLHLQPLKRLLLLHNFLDEVVEHLKVSVRNAVFLLVEEVVVEASLDGRAVAEVSAIDALHGLPEDVGGRMPKDPLALVVVKLDQLKFAGGLERTVKVPHLAVHLGHHRVVGQTYEAKVSLATTFNQIRTDQLQL